MTSESSKVVKGALTTEPTRTTNDIDRKALKKYIEKVRISDIIKVKNMTSDLTSSLSQNRDHAGAKIKLEILGIIKRIPICDLDISSLSKKTGTYGARMPRPPYIKKYSSLKRRGSNAIFVIVNESRFQPTFSLLTYNYLYVIYVI